MTLVEDDAIEPAGLRPEQMDAFFDGARSAVTYDGRVFGVPYAVENVALISNTGLLSRYPATIEELVQDGEALKASGAVKEVLCVPVGRAGDFPHVYPLFTAATGELFSTGTGGPGPPKVALRSPRSVKAFEKLRSLGEKGAGALRTSSTRESSVAGRRTRRRQRR